MLDNEDSEVETKDVQELPIGTPSIIPVNASIFEVTDMSQAQRVAKALMSSTLVPDRFSAAKVGDITATANCLFAIEMSRTMNISVFVIMQHLYVVKGTPSWPSKFLISLFNSTGKYTDIDYVMSGTEGQDDWGCRACCEDIATGRKISGTKITMKMAKGEGWTQNTKWINMPEQMLKYRAAAFMIRIECPELGMGFQTLEEIRDINIEKTRDVSPRDKLQSKLGGK